MNYVSSACVFCMLCVGTFCELCQCTNYVSSVRVPVFILYMLCVGIFCELCQCTNYVSSVRVPVFILYMLCVGIFCELCVEVLIL